MTSAIGKAIPMTTRSLPYNADKVEAKASLLMIIIMVVKLQFIIVSIIIIIIM